MVLSPEASSEWSEDAPGKSTLKNNTSLPLSGLFKTENLTTVTENGNVNNCPIEIKICGVENTDVAVKQPSYLSLARCISGYTLLTTYDSKQREGYRSRDISPIRAPLPLGMNSPYQTRSKTLAASTDGVVVATGDNSTRSDQCTSPSTSFSSMRAGMPFTSLPMSPESCVEKKLTIGVTMESKSCSQETESTSFVLQRVERLYGPGALAQGFYTRRSLNSRRSNDKQDEIKDHYNNTGSNYNDSNTANNHDNNLNVNGNGNTNTSFNGVDEALPVMKLLRPEFRAQLSLAKHKVRNSSVDKVDGTHQSPRKDHIIPIKLEVIESPEKYQKPVSLAQIENSQKKDGHHYLQVVHNEMKSLNRLADALQSDMDSVVIPEELEGQLRSAIGKARLLVNEKLRQFEGLCNKNILQDLSDNFPTTDEDLAGFWDMVSIQVESVHNEFEEIAKLKNNNWKQVITPKIKMVGSLNNTGSVNTRASDASCNGNKNIKCNNKTSSSFSKVNKPHGEATEVTKSTRDEARRKMLQERKLAMKRNMAANANQDQVFIS